MSEKPKPPASLQVTGKKLWADVVEKYDLRADELRVLGAACAASDMLALFEKEWASQGCPLTTEGSMGQLVEHPLIGSIDKQRKALAAFVKQLKLPDEAAGPKTNAQREGGAARWAAAHGA